MSYQDEANKTGREPLTIVDLDLDNTITEGGDEWVYSGEINLGSRAYPCLESIRYAPTRTGKFGGLGYIGSVSITLRDFPFPGGSGNWFQRLIASNPYYLNRKIRVYSGFLKKDETFNPSNFNIGEFFIKRIDGPDQNGRVRIQADDVLSRLRDKEVPQASTAELSANLNDTFTGSVGVSTLQYFPPQGYLLINDEILQYNGYNGPNAVIVINRGVGGTTAESHEQDDVVYQVFLRSGNVVDVIRDLIEDFSEIDHLNYIDDAEWNLERDTYLSGDDVTVWLIEDESLDKVIDRLAKQCMLAVWWDAVAQKIKIKALGPSLTTTKIWNDDEHILDDRVRIKRDQRDIITSVWSHYGIKNPVEDDKSKNYDGVYITVDTVAESGLGEPRQKTYFNSYVDGLGTASKMANRILSISRDPIELDIVVDATESAVEIGDLIDIYSSLIQGSDGLNKLTRMRVIEKQELENARYQYKMINSGVEIGSRYAKVAPNSIGVDYTAASDAEKDNYSFVANNSNEMSNGDDPYVIL